MPLRLIRRFFTLTILTLLAASCGDERVPVAPGATEYVTPTGLVTANPPQIFVGAGDIATCSNSGDEETARLLDTIPGTVFNLGDNVYPNGTNSEYANCYDPNWGRHKARTKPSAGNHDYNTSGASGYYNYFGASAGDPSKGYYSYDLGAWHIIALNSNISKSASSPQVQWLTADLAANAGRCTLAYFHHPLYSSSGSGSGGVTYSGVRPFIDALYAGGVDVYLAGHRHFYERMAPMKPNGTLDAANGIRTFIVGTGGIGGGNVSSSHPLTETADGGTRGVLKMYLYDDSYAWKFIPIAGKTYSDSGSAACHTAGTPPPPPPGGISPSNSTVGSSTGSLVASTGSSSATITVTVRDDNNDPVSGVGVTLGATGTGNSFTQPAATGANGTTSGSFSSTVAETKTITATVSGVALADQPQITVTPGPISGARSSVEASPGTIQQGSGSATITVTARDAYDNPIAGAAVTLDATGSGNTLTPPAAPTDASGVTTGALSSTGLGTKIVSATAGGTPIAGTATVLVTDQPPAAITHTLLTSGGNAVNQKAYTTASITPRANALVTVAVLMRRSSGALTPTVSGGGMAAWEMVTSLGFDTQGGPTKRLMLFRAMSGAPGSGPVTITFNSSVSNVQWIVSQWDGVETSGLNGAGAIGQTGVQASDAATSLAVALGPLSNTASVTYGIIGVAQNGPIVTPGSGFMEIAEQSSGESSALEAEYASNEPIVGASWTSSTKAGLLAVELKAGGAPGNTPPSASFGVSCTDRTCDFTSTSSDPGGSITGWDWTFGDGGTATSASPSHTYAADGTYTVELMVTDNEGATSAASQVVSVAQRVATALAFVTPPSNVEAGAVITPAVTVEVRDQFGDRLTSAATSVTVAIGTNPAGGTLGGILTLAAVNGVATFSTLTIDKIGSYTLTAAAAGLGGATSAGFDVTGPAVSPGMSEVAAAPDVITAGGVGATITVTARDGSGNPISDAVVELAVTGGGNTITAPAPTDGAGITTATLTSTGAGAKVVSATINGVPITPTATVTVSAGPPSPTLSTLAASPGTIALNSGSADIAVTVTDDYGNPVSGATVALEATGAGNALSPPGLTNASGVMLGTLSSSVAGEKIVSARVNGALLATTVSVQVTNAAPAAITHTLLAAGYGTTNQKVFTTAGLAPAADALVTVAVLGHRSSGASDSPTLEGGGMTGWDEVASVTFDDGTLAHKRLTIYRAMSGAPGSGPLTISFPSTVSNAQWIVSQWQGVETSGTNGAGAIVQTGANAADGVDGLAVSLAALASAANVAYGAFGAASNAAAMSPGAGFALIAEQPSNEGTTGDLLTQWAVGVTTVDATWSNLAAGALGVEIRAATAP